MGCVTEPGLLVSMCADAQPGDTVIAKWLDRHHAAVPLTCEELNSLSRKSSCAEGTGVLLDREHVATRHKISIRQRVDRQRCTCISRTVVSWGWSGTSLARKKNEHAQLSRDDPVLFRALKILNPFMNIYADGELNEVDLKGARDTKLHEMFPLVEKRSTKKARVCHPDALDVDSLLAPRGHDVIVGAQFVLARELPRTILEAFWTVRV